MKKILKNHWKISTTMLIVTSLIIMAVFGYGNGQLLVLAAAILWIVFNLLAFLIKKGAVVLSKIKPASNIDDEDEPDNFSGKELYEKALKLHFESRINDQLKSLYPDANWQWMKNMNPIALALGGEFGRIKVFNIPECDCIDIFQHQFGELTLKKISVIPLGQREKTVGITKPEDKITVPPKRFSISDWIKGDSGDELFAIVRELNTKGHNKMLVDESGYISVVRSEGNVENHCFSLPDFPPKANWKELLETIKGEGLFGSFTENDFCVEWKKKG